MIDTRFAPYGALSLRVALGVMFIAHAYLKLAIFTVPRFRRLPRPDRPTRLPRLADHPGGDARWARHPHRLLWPLCLARLAADPARRAQRPRPQWLAVHRPERRLGISRLPRRRRRCACADRRWRPGAAPCRLRRRFEARSRLSASHCRTERATGCCNLSPVPCSGQPLSPGAVPCRTPPLPSPGTISD